MGGDSCSEAERNTHFREQTKILSKILSELEEEGQRNLRGTKELERDKDVSFSSSQPHVQRWSSLVLLSGTFPGIFSTELGKCPSTGTIATHWSQGLCL